jgi:nitrate/TMAO reductase-like tetraheme cytochrome c subunit
MSWSERAGKWLRPVFFLGHNRLTLTGAVLTSGSALTMVGFWALEVLQLRHIHPYAGIILFMVLPVVFVIGLVLMPLGILLRRRRLRADGQLPETYPTIDLNVRLLQRGLVLFGGATVFNVGILATAAYKGVDYMDSPQFCGLTCHNVMAPEHTAYVGSPHARVSCTDCHIGEGASWFVRSKLSGTRQVFAVAFGTYSRPIPSPVKHLRPARETCETCHWPRRFTGDKLVVRTKYQDDEKNTPLVNVLLLKIGGHGVGGAVGIHGRHLDEASRISYVSTDGKRQVIPRVEYRDDSGKTVEFVSTEIKATPEQLARGERRQMDCMDCHNRPTHTFEMPERAVDNAMSAGAISPELPFVKKKAVELLRAEYPDRETAAVKILGGLTDYYKKEQPTAYANHRALVEAAAQQVNAIYQRNVFPNMKVGWGTYPNNIGHDDFLGCFRCHDDNHKSADGRTISQDCGTCHAVLAMEEKDPKILESLGLK